MANLAMATNSKRGRRKKEWKGWEGDGRRVGG